VARSRLLLPLVRLGRFDEAARVHAAGYARVAWRRDRFDAIGRHLEYLALREDPADALQLLREHERMAADVRCEGELWSWRCGAWLVRARNGPAESRAAARPLREKLDEVADRFDRRNGNDRRRRELAQVEARLQWPPLPSTAADAFTWSRPRSPSGSRSS
jgi:hypothetical protein